MEVTEVQSVTTLDLSNQSITEMPIIEEHMSVIKHVDLSKNCLKSIPQVLQSSRHLLTMNCAHNSISIFTSKSLDLEEDSFLKPKIENKFELNDPVDSIYSEEELNEGSSSVLSKSSDESNSVDSGIQLVADTCFDFSQMYNLQCIDLSHNEIQFFPETLSELTNIESLNLSHNLITYMPQSFKSASKIKYLDISWNQLNEVPVWIGQLEKCLKLR